MLKDILLKKYFFLFFFFPLYIISNPSTPKVVHGEVNFSKEAGTLTINQNSHKAIIDWKKFSIDKNEVTKIVQPSKSSCSLNRVISKDVSHIFGTLSSNGKVFLINKNGIVIGKSGLIKTQKFIASTLDIANSEFLKDENINFFKNENGKVENKGKILGEKGVYIFSKKIKNEGSIESPKGDVNLIGAEEIFIFKEDENIIIKPKGLGSIDNKGTLKALNVALKASNIDSFAINQEGFIEANTIYEENGKVFLGSKKGTINIKGEVKASKDRKGGEVEVIGKEIKIDGKIDVSGELEGGVIDIGKKGYTDDIFISKDSLLKADAIEGDGGKIFLWGDKKNHFYGNISAETVKGDGGFVEISSKEDLLFKGRVSTLSSFGKTGELTLDPVDINITNSSPSNPAFVNPYQPAVSPANLYVVDLTTALAGSNVTVRTDGTGGNSNGTINVQTNITWAANTKLTLIADRTIDIAGGIVLSNTFSGANFDAFDFQTTAAITGATYNGIVLNTLAQITSVDGNITLLGRGGPIGNSNQGILLDDKSLVSSTGSAQINLTGVGGGGGATGTNTNYGIHLDGAVGVPYSIISSSSTGNILLTGSSNGRGNNNYGIYLSGNNGTIDSSGTATITLRGTGGSATSTNDNYGIDIEGVNVTVQSVDGDITLYGVSNGTTTNNFGVYMGSGSEVLSTNNAKIIFSNGLGGNPCKGGPGTDYCEGIHIDAATITAGTGDVSLKGEGNTSGTGSYNRGINFQNGGEIDATASTANVSVEGIGGNGVNSNVGVYIYGNTSDILSNTGNITVKGTGRGSGNNNHGVHLAMNSNNKIESTGGGNISVEGVSGTGGSSHSVYLEAGNIVSQSVGSIQIKGYGSGSGYAIYNNSQNINAVNGGVTLIGNSMNLAGGSIIGQTDLKVYPYSILTSIGLAGGGGALLLPASALNTFVNGFNLITIGDNTNTFSIRCDAYTFLDPIKFIAVDSITIIGNLSAGANNIDFLTAQGEAGYLRINSGVSITAGAFTATGGAFNDDFYIYASGINGTLSGGGGTNTFYGPTAGSTWNITANDAGNITGGPTFSAFANLVGGTSGNDTFILSDGFGLTGTLNGNSSSGNTLNYAAYTTPVSVNIANSSATNIFGGAASGFSNIQNFVGGTTGDTFRGYSGGGTWNITANNGGNITGGPTFSSFESLIGGSSGSDIFILSDGVGLTGTLNGNSGSGNTLNYAAYTTPVSVNYATGAATNIFGGAGGGFSNIQSFVFTGNPADIFLGLAGGSTWYITGTNTGYISGGPSFSNLATLTGDAGGNDSFIFNIGGYISNNINGNGGANNSITIPPENTTVTISAAFSGSVNPASAASSSFSNIHSFIGNTGNDVYTINNNINSITENSGNNTYNINGGTITSIIGGSNNDIFYMNGGTISNIDGGLGGVNTLVGPNLVNTWNITGINAGSIGATIFSNMTTLIGNSLPDNFIFSAGASISGTVNGVGTSNNSFDYSGFGAPVFVNINNNSATNVNGGAAGGFTNIQGFLGSGSPGDSFTGLASGNIWNIVANDTGNIIGGPTFNSFANLIGGSSGVDIFILADTFGVTGSIDGNSSSGNILDYSNYTSAITVNLENSSATNIKGGAAGGFLNIQSFFASGDVNDTLIGQNAGNIWNVNAVDSGNITGVATFVDFLKLVGGTGNDTFNFSLGGAIGTSINGGAGTNNIVGPVDSVVWTITGANSGNINPSLASVTNFSNIQNLNGNSGDDHFSINNSINNITDISGNNIYDINVGGVVNSIVGGSNNDTFNLNGGTITTIDGGAGGLNDIIGPNAVNTWNVTGSDAGSLGALSFSNITRLVGNAQPDTFVFSAGSSISCCIDGIGSNNTLDYSAFLSPIFVNLQDASVTNVRGGVAGGILNIQNFIGSGSSGDLLRGVDGGSIWNITLNNAGNITGGPSFSSFANLRGGNAGGDAFILSDGVGVSGTINGNSSSGNMLNYSSYSTAITVNLEDRSATNIYGGAANGFSNIQLFIASAKVNDTLIGQDVGSFWNITGFNSGNITGGPSFISFLKLRGGAFGDDVFNFGIGGSINNFIDGNGGSSNTVIAPAEDTIWTVNGIHSGIIDPLSAVTTNFFNIQILNGSSGDDTYNLNSGDMEYINELSGNNTYNINGGTITSIIGGSNNDIFYLNGGIISTIDGGVGGVNTLVGDNVVNTWNITGINAGDVGGVIFSNITDLTGNLQPDTFVFSDQKGVAGIVNGIGLDNTLDYSNYTPPVYVDLGAGTATGTGGILNIQNVIYPPEPPVPPIPPIPVFELFAILSTGTGGILNIQNVIYPPEPPVPPIPIFELFAILSTDASLTYKIDYSEYESFYFYDFIYLDFFECYKDEKRCFIPLRYSKLFKIFIK